MVRNLTVQKDRTVYNHRIMKYQRDIQECGLNQVKNTRTCDRTGIRTRTRTCNGTGAGTRDRINTRTGTRDRIYTRIEIRTKGKHQDQRWSNEEEEESVQRSGLRESCFRPRREPSHF